MRVGPDGNTHLTYCSNIHPGETWAELRSNIEQHATAVKERVAPTQAFGLGLRISAAAAAELAVPERLEELRDLLARNDLYVFTINGFPYGDFHGPRVKTAVYRPDWREAARLRYTDLLARLLAELLPPGVDGSVSTVPVGFAPRFADLASEETAAAAIRAHSSTLHELRARTGKTIGLALEPEPGCLIETTGGAVAFLEERVFCRASIAKHAASLGRPEHEAEASLRRHVGLCLDTCHAAVGFEVIEDSLDLIERAGIRVWKIQLSAGLRVPGPGDEALEALTAFAEDRYLHQVAIRDAEGIRRYLDLPEALADRTNRGRPDTEWRVHFHIPLFLEALAPLGGTHTVVEEILTHQRTTPLSPHLEVETYTWEVLPERYRRTPVVTAIARELAWVRERLRA